MQTHIQECRLEPIRVPDRGAHIFFFAHVVSVGARHRAREYETGRLRRRPSRSRAGGPAGTASRLQVGGVCEWEVRFSMLIAGNSRTRCRIR
jgi:hypothetical protein